MRLMGLDISTTTIGISVLDFNDRGKCKPIYINYYHPIKHTIEDKNIDFLNMLSLAKKHILEIIEIHKPDHIAVEDFIRFLKGRSGAGTILPLATLNRTICLAVFENYLNIHLHIYNVLSIRTQIKKDSGLKDLPPKENIPKLLEKLLKIKIPCPTKQTKKGIKILDQHFDMADGIAVGYYCYKKLREKKEDDS